MEEEAREFTGTEEVEVLHPEMIDRKIRTEILDLLEEAYSQSPLMNYLAGKRIKKVLRTYQEMAFELIMDAGGWITVVRSEGGSIAGIALWLPPNVEISALKAMSFMPVILKSFGFRCFVKALWLFVMIMIAETRAKKEFKRRPKIYLANIAVKVSEQRKGYAGKLFKPIIDLADEKNYVVYLEADGRINTDMVYPKFGFKKLRKIWLDYYFSMIRFPSQ